MKIFLLFTSLIFAAYLLGSICKSNVGEWMSRDFITAIKGFSILTVVWAHTGARLGVGGIQFIAGIGVALFLICSGYGLEISYEKSGLQGFVRKRLFKVCIPFWIVELTGLIVVGEFTVKGYILDALFIKQATGYGWFMQYIVICYIIFFAAKMLMERIGVIREHEMAVIFTVFIAWFVVDSLFFASSSMPFLRARQMLCFPTGMMIAKYKYRSTDWLSNKFKYVLIGSVGGVLVATFLMAITQTRAVKAMPYLVSNFMSLGTCFVYALVVLVIGYSIPRLFQSWTLRIVGTISYEIYLVHAFSLRLIDGSYGMVILFLVSTILGGLILHIFLTSKLISNHHPEVSK